MEKYMGKSRYQIIAPVLFITILSFTLVRMLFTVLAWDDIHHSLLSLGRIYFSGFIYDAVFISFALVLPVLFILLLPERLWRLSVNRYLVHGTVLAVIYAIGFVAVAEYFFWNEFQVRFNFISVDYLIYRREVTDNINESFPVPVILSSILIFSLIIYRLVYRQIDAGLLAKESFLSRMKYAIILLILPVVGYFVVDSSLYQEKNAYQEEIAHNGPYEFFAAFRNNELDYRKFYATIPDEKVAEILDRELELPARSSEDGLSIYRTIHNPGPERRLNIVLVMVESLSAKYLGTFGNTEHLTPFLDQFSQESLSFDRFYATGTRTTRGLEAVTLSIPPTPGRSIVKRIGRESGMWSLGNVLKSKGYSARFLYGGRGYFDNMNGFFTGNGYEITDQSTVSDDEIVFTNAWGMSDEDLYKQTIKEADKAYSDNKPFFFHVMTTSNHRPYTYPPGRIDIPSGEGREGAVKYTDWALQDMLSRAESKPWFDDTVFVIVADHCAGSAGRVSLPLNRYHIPLFIYSPRYIKPEINSTLASQIDLAPTLLSLLNMDYESASFGRDILTTTPEASRALIANYQHLGLYNGQTTTMLSPKNMISRQADPGSDNPVTFDIQQHDSLVDRVIGYYEGASEVYDEGLNAWPPTRSLHPNTGNHL